MSSGGNAEDKSDSGRCEREREAAGLLERARVRGLTVGASELANMVTEAIRRITGLAAELMCKDSGDTALERSVVDAEVRVRRDGLAKKVERAEA